MKKWRFEAYASFEEASSFAAGWIPSSGDMKCKIKNLADLEALRNMMYPELGRGERMDRGIAKIIQKLS